MRWQICYRPLGASFGKLFGVNEARKWSVAVFRWAASLAMSNSDQRPRNFLGRMLGLRKSTKCMTLPLFVESLCMPYSRLATELVAISLPIT